jgi:predicted methyltransferase
MKFVFGLILTLFILPAHAGLDWESALGGEHRSADSQDRNSSRHPQQTLEFFGLREGMTVLEVSPGGGWYTEVLAPLVANNGTFYAAHAALNAPRPYYRNSLGKYLVKMAAAPEVYGSVVITQLQPPEEVQIAPPGSVDLVVAFRNVHSWMRAGSAEQTLAAAFAALKPGGVFGLVQHRARPGTSIEEMKSSGYVTEEKVISLLESAGFTLAEKSEINANPKDTADHPKGVWTLPPALRLGEVDREKYLAIGESDRMTMKFIKPE